MPFRLVIKPDSSISSQVGRARKQWYAKAKLKPPARFVFTSEGSPLTESQLIEGLLKRKHEGEQFLLVLGNGGIRRI